MQSIHQLKKSMTCGHLESCFVGEQNSLEIFVPIHAIFVDLLGQ